MTPLHTPATARPRIRLVLIAFAVAALVLLVARVDSAAASTPCAPAPNLLAIDAVNASCFEGFDGDQVAAAPHIDWRSILGSSTFSSIRDDTGDSTFTGGDKENDPGGWTLDSAGSAQSKVDVLAAATATDDVSGDVPVRRVRAGDVGRRCLRVVRAEQGPDPVRQRQQPRNAPHPDA